ncbi:hypothetical protein BC829DRAFT_403829 [Chytridium lagenaria]|nr:hypothetical protein BC829DRAFT_403829 [Chytridium lagenaria]
MTPGQLVTQQPPAPIPEDPVNTSVNTTKKAIIAEATRMSNSQLIESGRGAYQTTWDAFMKWLKDENNVVAYMTVRCDPIHHRNGSRGPLSYKTAEAFYSASKWWFRVKANCQNGWTEGLNDKQERVFRGNPCDAAIVLECKKGPPNHATSFSHGILKQDTNINPDVKAYMLAGITILFYLMLHVEELFTLTMDEMQPLSVDAVYVYEGSETYQCNSVGKYYYLDDDKRYLAFVVLHEPQELARRARSIILLGSIQRLHFPGVTNER